MSNTSTVSMYDDVADDRYDSSESDAYSGSSYTAGNSSQAASASATVAIAACAAAAADAVEWLTKTTEADQRAIVAHRQSRRQERLIGRRSRAQVAGGMQPVSTTRLHLRNPELLVATAETLGYARAPQSPRRQGTTSVLMVGRTGERIAIQSSPSGRAVVRTTSARAAQTLVREHVVRQAVTHLTSAGYKVATQRLANGELQLAAQATPAAAARGAPPRAKIRAQVRNDGNAEVDIDCVEGSACETIARDFSRAIGGELNQMRKKQAYFQLPGEPARVRNEV